MCVQEGAHINMTNIATKTDIAPRRIDRNGLAARWATSTATLKRLEKKGVLNIIAISERVLRYNLEDIERIEAEQKAN